MRKSAFAAHSLCIGKEKRCSLLALGAFIYSAFSRWQRFFVLFCFVLFGYPLNRKQMTVFFVAGTAARSRNRITTKFVLNAFCAEQMNEQIWQKYVVMNC
jgi:hypothetical protein